MALLFLMHVCSLWLQGREHAVAIAGCSSTALSAEGGGEGGGVHLLSAQAQEALAHYGAGPGAALVAVREVPLELLRLPVLLC